ncbi:hypothetical protein BLM37_03245 [Candidatus Gracilibacteria bacterium GN02-873]|nr:hypothetical protein BLM37_03245 [Candidatus Gracilibacteria bacterium GN02-873]
MKKYIFNVECKLYGTLELELEDSYTEEEAIKAIQDKIDNDSEYQLLQNLETENIDIYQIIDLPHIFDNRKNQIPKKGNKFQMSTGIGEVVSVDKKNEYACVKLDGNPQIQKICFGLLWDNIFKDKGYFNS